MPDSSAATAIASDRQAHFIMPPVRADEMTPVEHGAVLNELVSALESARNWIDRAEQHMINRVAGGKAIQQDLGAGTLAEIDAKISSALGSAYTALRSQR